MPLPFGFSFGGNEDPMTKLGTAGRGIQGLLSDPAQQAKLAGNPMLNAGMGLLASSYDANINPFQAAMQGLQKGATEQQTQEDRERQEKAREAIAAYFGSLGQQVPGQAPPTAQEQALQMSLAPGQPGAAMGAGGAPPVNPNSRQVAYASLPGGDDMQRQQRRMAWEQIIGR